MINKMNAMQNLLLTMQHAYHAWKLPLADI